MQTQGPAMHWDDLHPSQMIHTLEQMETVSLTQFTSSVQGKDGTGEDENS